MPVNVTQDGNMDQGADENPQKKTHNLRSPEAQEVISRKTGFLAGWSLLIICAMITTLLTWSWLIPFPDTISLRGRLSVSTKQSTAFSPGIAEDISKNNYYMNVLVPEKNIGKITTGQEAIINFDAYPAEDFGYIKGHFEYISDTIQTSGVRALIKLSPGMHSNLNKKPHYFEGLSGEATVTLGNVRFIHKIFPALFK